MLRRRTACVLATIGCPASHLAQCTGAPSLVGYSRMDAALCHRGASQSSTREPFGAHEADARKSTSSEHLELYS